VLVRTFLSLVPPDLRQSDGTFGVNLFRTFTNVVSKPHRDNERFVILYVLDRVGDGAETSLYNAADPTAEPVLRHQLDPGELIIFDDERFMHDASPLVPPPGGVAHRDVLVCTVDDPRTYLSQDEAAIPGRAVAVSGAPAG
jgi:2OG-Fe dioxygenase